MATPSTVPAGVLWPVQEVSHRKLTTFPTVINNWLREGQRRMRRSTARCNKLTRNRRQGLCVV
uniref:Uncharacterized protein n=1 Tax=Oryza glumipatula TaxID=40148 RepID=A0A0D9ZWT9_9ORYZ